MKKYVAVLFLFLLVPFLAVAEEAAPKGAIRIDKVSVGSAIDDKEVTGTGTEFDGSIEQLYCWTRVVADDAPTRINHVWSLDGKKVANVTLKVDQLITRTWSRKRVRPGAWKVDVTDESGTVLASQAFTVNKPVASTSPQ
jgi:hypothetical protein